MLFVINININMYFGLKEVPVTRVLALRWTFP